MKRERVQALAVSFVLTVACVIGSGCATGKVAHTGFLSDYSKLQPGPKGGAAFVYVEPGVNWATYDKVILEPVLIWYSPDADYKGISPADLTALSDYFTAALAKNLVGAYTIAADPGPGVLRIRVAITNVIPSNPAMNTITGTVPQARIVSAVSKVTTGSNLFVGEASAEFELLDSQTNTVLAEAVDHRAGKNPILKVEDKWADAKEAMDYWAKRMRQRLDEAREK